MEDQDPLVRRADLLIQSRRWAEGEQLLRQAILNNPQAARPRSMLAFCLLEIDRHKEAAEMAREAIALAPDEAFGHYALTVVLLQSNRFSEAQGPIEEAIRLNPFEPQYFGALANIHLEQRQWQTALDAANRGLALDPEQHWCINIRGMALVHLGDRKAAATTIQGALQKDPENAFTHANRGWGLLHENKPKQAMEHFREALRLDPTMEFARTGIVEAMKARNPLYRMLLLYFLLMSRQSRSVQIVTMIGGYVGFRILVQLNEEFPTLGPYVLPLIVAYMAFALSTWLAPVLMNMLLRLDRFGRHALSESQIKTCNLIGMLLLSATAMFTTAYFMHDNWLFTAALFTTGMAIPASRFFDLPNGWPRWAAIGALAILISIGGYEVFREWQDTRPGYIFNTFYIFCYGTLGTSILVQFLQLVRIKR